MWTFETSWGETWSRSQNTYEKMGEAARQMADWAIICAENGVFPEIRLVKLPDLGMPMGEKRHANKA